MAPTPPSPDKRPRGRPRKKGKQQDAEFNERLVIEGTLCARWKINGLGDVFKSRPDLTPGIWRKQNITFLELLSRQMGRPEAEEFLIETVEKRIAQLEKGPPSTPILRKFTTHDAAAARVALKWSHEAVAVEPTFTLVQSDVDMVDTSGAVDDAAISEVDQLSAQESEGGEPSIVDLDSDDDVLVAGANQDEKMGDDEDEPGTGLDFVIEIDDEMKNPPEVVETNDTVEADELEETGVAEEDDEPTKRRKPRKGGTGRGPGRWPKGSRKSDYGPNAISGPGLWPGRNSSQEAGQVDGADEIEDALEIENPHEAEAMDGDDVANEDDDATEIEEAAEAEAANAVDEASMTEEPQIEKHTPSRYPTRDRKPPVETLEILLPKIPKQTLPSSGTGEAVPGSEAAPWFKLTPAELEDLSRRLQGQKDMFVWKNGSKVPSPTAIARELMLKGRGLEAYKQASAKAKARPSSKATSPSKLSAPSQSSIHPQTSAPTNGSATPTSPQLPQPPPASARVNTPAAATAPATTTTSTTTTTSAPPGLPAPPAPRLPGNQRQDSPIAHFRNLFQMLCAAWKVDHVRRLFQHRPELEPSWNLPILSALWDLAQRLSMSVIQQRLAAMVDIRVEMARRRSGAGISVTQRQLSMQIQVEDCQNILKNLQGEGHVPVRPTGNNMGTNNGSPGTNDVSSSNNGAMINGMAVSSNMPGIWQGIPTTDWAASGMAPMFNRSHIMSVNNYQAVASMHNPANTCQPHTAHINNHAVVYHNGIPQTFVPPPVPPVVHTADWLAPTRSEQSIGGAIHEVQTGPRVAESQTHGTKVSSKQRSESQEIVDDSTKCFFDLARLSATMKRCTSEFDEAKMLHGLSTKAVMEQGIQVLLRINELGTCKEDTQRLADREDAIIDQLDRLAAFLGQGQSVHQDGLSTNFTFPHNSPANPYNSAHKKLEADLAETSGRRQEAQRQIDRAEQSLQEAKAKEKELETKEKQCCAAIAAAGWNLRELRAEIVQLMQKLPTHLGVFEHTLQTYQRQMHELDQQDRDPEEEAVPDDGLAFMTLWTKG